VVVRDGARYVEDLGSTNGTHVAGHALVAEHRLRVGDEVRVGETELRYEE
jgi:pSer/pThr/pTyr-binding forkhead associated (FHA) protein